MKYHNKELNHDTKAYFKKNHAFILSFMLVVFEQVS